MNEFVKKFPYDGTTFGAKHAAEKWLFNHGYSFGSSCVLCPQAIIEGDVLIAKWRNLTPREKRFIDGTLEAGRNTDAVIKLKSKPKPLHVIKVKTDVWIDSGGQLIYKKTIRQMRTLTDVDWYAFEEELGGAGGPEGLEGIEDLADGLYRMACYYDTDEHGVCDGVSYSFHEYRE